MNFGNGRKKDSLYDDGLPGIRWRFPHQFENWFGMTMLFDARSFLYKFQFTCFPDKADMQ